MKLTKGTAGAVLILAGLVAGCGPTSGSLSSTTSSSPSPVSAVTTEAPVAITAAPTTTAPAAETTAPAVVTTPPPAPIQTQAPAPAPATPAYDPPQPVNTYTNVDGNVMPGPQSAAAQPAGATAKCNDGTWSFSAHHQGSCSSHGGVAYFLN